MDGDNIGKPERKIGQVFRNDFLDCTAERFAFFLIHFRVNLIGKHVNARDAVVSTVGAIGREAFGGIDEFKDVRVGVGARPSEGD